MSFDAHVLKILIASPGDTSAERDAVERALHGWNGDRAERELVILLPRRWEMNAVPRLGGDGQSVINDQLVDSSDIVIALFDSRLGSATETAVSGTAEEIQRSHEVGKPVHVWFSDEPIPRSADLDQVKALEDFKATLQPLGLLGTYASPDDLAYKVRQAIESDLAHLELGAVQKRSPAADHAVLRARYDSEREQYLDGRGRISYRTGRQRLIIRNTGTAAAIDVRVELHSLEAQASEPQLLERPTPTLIPESEFSWPLVLAMGMATTFRVIMTWNEGEDERSESQDLSAS